MRLLRGYLRPALTFVIALNIGLLITASSTCAGQETEEGRAANTIESRNALDELLKKDDELQAKVSILEWSQIAQMALRANEYQFISEDFSSLWSSHRTVVPTVEKQRHVVSIIATALSDQPIDGTIETHFLLPTTDAEFHHVFGRLPSKHSANQMKDAQVSLKREFGANSADDGTNAATVLSLITHSKSAFVMLVGHNLGQEMAFRKGPSISFSKLIDAANSANKSLVLISCDAAQTIESHPARHVAATTATVLTFEQAVTIAKTVRARVSASKSTSLNEVRGFVKDSEATAHVRTKTLTVIKLVSGTSGVVIAVILVIEALDCSAEHSTGSPSIVPCGPLTVVPIPKGH